MGKLVIMSQMELYRLEIIQRITTKRLLQAEAAKQLNISTRQIRRLLRSYERYGPEGLSSKRRNQPSNNRLPEKLCETAIRLISDKYHDFGPTLACEKLAEIHNIHISKETLRKLMIKAGLWTPRTQRLKRAYQPRYRRSCFGELIQIDGSTHHWFEDRGPKCTLLVYIDDATSQITSLYFAPSESMHTYFLATQQHLKQYGKPIAFYSDRLGIFKVHPKTAQDKIMTQFGRALYELNIDLICANTCQAKGRVERANLTLQDRLVKELRLRNISSITEANLYLPEFIKDYNKRFRKAPISDLDAHRPLQEHEDLDEALCFKQERTVSLNLTIQYDRVLYLIEDTLENRLLRRKKIMLHEYPDGSISLNSNGRRLQFRKMYDRVQPIEQGRTIPNERISSILEFIKENQKERQYRRSTRCPRKGHLELIKKTSFTLVMS